MGLETPVVHAVNNGYLIFIIVNNECRSKRINIPPGDYDRKIET
jgi:hypothetical protein